MVGCSLLYNRFLPKAAGSLLCDFENARPPITMGGFLLESTGVKMRLAQEIEEIRKKCGLTLTDMCNIMNTSEAGYRYLIAYNVRPTNYQLITFIMATEHGLKNI